MAPSASDSISIQTPRAGIIFAPKYLLPLFSDSVKKTPKERASCGTITRSTPLIMKVPWAVIKGNSDIKISCSFSVPKILFFNFTRVFKSP